MDDNLPLFASAPEPEMDVVHSDHALWLASEGREGRRAHFRKSELNGKDVSGKCFAKASLRGITIRDAIMMGTDLRDCDMSDTIFENVDLRGALLNGSMLSHAQFHNVNLEAADLDEAELLGLVAKDTNFAGVKMNHALLRDADLQNVNFSYATLQGSNLRGSRCSNSRFDHVDLSHADCRDAAFEYCSFGNAIVKAAQFKDTRLTAVNVHGLDFAGAHDMVFDLQTQMLLEERTALQQEHEQFAHDRIQLEEMSNRLNHDQKKLNAQEENLLLREKTLGLALPYFMWIVRANKTLCALWTAVATILMVFTLDRLAQIGVGRVSGIIAGVGMVLILCFLSLYFALKTRAILINITARVQKIPKK